MKKTHIAILGISAWVLGLGMGILVSAENKTHYNEEIVEEKIKIPDIQAQKTSIVNKKVIPATKIIYKYCYGDRDETKESDAPDFLIGKNREEVQMAMPEWNVESFSEKKIVLSKIVEESVEEQYIVSNYEGYVAAFSKTAEKDNLIEVTSTPVSSLLPDEQDNINRGIILNSRYELSRCMENYGS